MGVVFDHKQSVFVVGGTGDKSGVSYPGGCTKAWYDANFTALTDIMGDDGAPLIAETNANYDHTGAAEGEHKIYQANAGEFADAQVGMVAHISGTNITPGKYEITGVDATNGHYVLVSGIVATGDASDVTINIGGAFSSMALALTDTDASSYGVAVHINKTVDVSGSTLNIASAGEINTGSFLHIKGFNTLPGDMDYGGDYYVPSKDFSDGDLIKIDGGGTLSDDIITLGASIENLILENLDIYNNTGAGNDGITASNAYGILLKHCAIRSVDEYGDSNWYGSMIDDCYFGIHRDVSGLLPSGFGAILKNSFFDGTSNTYNARIQYWIVHNCIITASTAGLRLRYGIMFNSIFYNHTTRSLMAEDAIVAIGNIFYLADITDYAIDAWGLVEGGSTTIDYNIAYSANGALTNPFYDTNNSRTMENIGDHNLYEDPLLDDPTSGNYEPTLKSSVWFRGKPDMNENLTHIGPFEWYGQRGINKSNKFANVSSIAKA